MKLGTKGGESSLFEEVMEHVVPVHNLNPLQACRDARIPFLVTE